jgi:hypothetical protein
MPYIDRIGRSFWDPKLKELETYITDTDPDVGAMNYMITKMLLAWVKNKLRYVRICMVMGTLICVMFEFYRRIAAPYEETKIKENGDVY